jgi:hypothetical protein
MDDWGSFESKPEFTADKLTGIGLYTSDVLTEGYVPVGMDSPEQLAETFEKLTEKFRVATVELWKRMAGWSRDQMMDAGAIVYFSIIKDFAHVAGVYDVDDWMKIDERADRFRPLLNDEFGRDFLGELVGLVDLPTQQLHDYAMMQHNNQPSRYISHIPYSVLNRTEQTAIAPMTGGVSHFSEKIDRYVTSAGAMSLEEYNAKAQQFRPTQMTDGYRFLCDTSVRYHPESEAALSLYRLEQEQSQLLSGKGTGLTRSDIEDLRRDRL